MNLQSKLTTLALIGAEWVLWLLLALSILSIAVILERAVFFVTSRDDVQALGRRLSELMAKGEVAEAQRALDASPSIEARIGKAALAGDVDGAEGRVRAATGLARLRMERSLSMLGTLGTNAPFVGLLGTVIGIIGAFHELDASGGRVSTALMAEIGEALVVTGLGLVVALPAVVGFNLLTRLVQVRLDRGAALAETLLAASPRSSAPASGRSTAEKH
jgi:biopolymer transport protein ExbB